MSVSAFAHIFPCSPPCTPRLIRLAPRVALSWRWPAALRTQTKHRFVWSVLRAQQSAHCALQFHVSSFTYVSAPYLGLVQQPEVRTLRFLRSGPCVKIPDRVSSPGLHCLSFSDSYGSRDSREKKEQKVHVYELKLTLQAFGEILTVLFQKKKQTGGV